MKIYIAGQITGNPGYREDFQKAVDYYSGSDAWEVLNPAILPEGMRAEDYMRICFAMIFSADVVAFLPNAGKSRVAILEHELCCYIGKKFIFLEEVPEFMNEWRAKEI